MKAAIVCAVSVLFLVAGCIGSQEAESPTTSSTVTTHTSTSSTESTTSTTTQSVTSTSTTTTTTLVQAQSWVEAPKPGCECVQWVCPTITTTSTSTSTTCLRLPYDGYEPKAIYADITIKGHEFDPDELEAFVGDTIIANITNRRGLHKIRETCSNKTIILGPGQSYELIFYAEYPGEYELTCNPFCEEPMQARILVETPYKKIC